MNAEGIREIANMQNSIDKHNYFLSHLYLRLKHPERDITLIESEDEICSEIWEEIGKLQSKVKKYECKTSTSD